MFVETRQGELEKIHFENSEYFDEYYDQYNKWNKLVKHKLNTSFHTKIELPNTILYN